MLWIRGHDILVIMRYVSLRPRTSRGRQRVLVLLDEGRGMYYELRTQRVNKKVVN